MPRTLGIVTQNPLKLREFVSHFRRYGITCVQVDPTDDWEAQLSERPMMGVLEEQTALFSLTRQVNLHGTPDDFDAVTHISTLTYRTLRDGALRTFSYEDRTDGTIDLSRDIVPRPEDCYHWDAVFVVDRCGLSLYEIRQRTGQKISSRDLNIARFIREHVHYKKPRDLHHRPQNLPSVVDFDADRATRVLCALVHRGSDFIRFPLTVLNQGVFLRSADSRRSFVYWCPGLNAGLPLVPKPKDPMHEKTFMFHDVVHFLLPDLVFDGTVSPRHKLAYVAHRMSSEILSLVVADMLFVSQSIEPYPTVAKRRILPLYEAFGPAPDLERLLEGAFRYGFYLDDAIWRQMIDDAGGDPAALDRFREKYDNYILQDFRWTLHNWDVMVAHADDARRWWRDFGGFAPGAWSTSDYLAQTGIGDSPDRDAALWATFCEMRDRLLRVLEAPPPRLELKRGRARAIDGYLVGQARIFYRFDFLPQTAYYRDRMREALRRPKRPALAKLRALYSKYLRVLVENRLINPDDERLYQQVYPIFDFTLIRYDERPDLEPLAALSWP